MSAAPRKDNWNSRIGVILAVAGSAVGLGNFLRFPGLVAEYGGGAFMIAYFISLILLGLPICWAEWTMGRMGGKLGFNSAPGILEVITRRPKYRYLGVIGVVIPVCIYMYYVVIEAWCLAYAVNYLRGGTMAFVNEAGLPDTDAAGNFFGSLVGIEANGSAFHFNWEHVGFFVIGVFILNFVLIYRGISRGIEWFCKFAMPLLVIVALVILARVLTLGTPDPSFPERNIVNGLGFMWNPNKVVLQESSATPEQLAAISGGANAPQLTWKKVEQLFEENRIAEKEALAAANPFQYRVVELSLFDQLKNPELWIAAAGQIFFSLSVGFGVIITYSSYLRRKDDVVLSGLAATSANEFCEVGIGGLLSVPAGVAFLGTATVMASLSTFGIGFTVLPLVFAQMPGGMFFGFLFFFLLFLAAVTSSLSMLQPGIAFLEDSMGISRKQSMAILGLITAFGCGFVIYFSGGLKALDTMDTWIANLLMVSLALIQIIVFAWVIGVEKGFAEAREGAAFAIPGFFKFVMKFITPVFLLVILGSWLKSSVIGTVNEDGIRVFSSYIQDLFPVVIGQNADGSTIHSEVSLVAWLSVALIILVGLFVSLVAKKAHPRESLEANPAEN